MSAKSYVINVGSVSPVSLLARVRLAIAREESYRLPPVNEWPTSVLIAALSLYDTQAHHAWWSTIAAEVDRRIPTPPLVPT